MKLRGEEKIESNAKIGVRAILLGFCLATLFSAVNGYLSINFGMSFGYGAFAVLIAYSLFHRLGGGSFKKELSFVLIASTSSMAMYNALAFMLYAMQTDSSISFPSWVAPPKEAVIQGSLELAHWILPIAFFITTTIFSIVTGLIFASILKNQFLKSRRLIWPNTSAEAALVDTCMGDGGSARLVGVSALVGLVVTFIQYLPLMWEYDLTSVNLSPYLPTGFSFAISLSIAFAAIGYMINVRTALSLMGSGLITYLVISPVLVSWGTIKYSTNPMAVYNELLFNFSMGPALGVLLLGGVMLSVFMLVKSKLKKASGREGSNNGDVSLDYVSLYKIFIKGLASNKRYLITVGSVAAVLLSLAWILNPFSPMPPIFSVVVTIYAFFLGSFIELVLIVKMSGETGMSMGVMSMFLYDFPIFGAGYRGYTGYWTYGYFRPGPGITNGILPYLKYEEQFDVTWRDIVKAKIVGWVPTLIFSMVFTIILWKYVGFGTPMMPSVSLIQNKVYLQMLATGDIFGTINPWTFIAGGIIGPLLELFTPVSMMGLAMGMFLPPHYVVPFGVGGLVRWYTDKRYGKEFYQKKGRLIVTGLMASSLIVQVIMTILVKVV